MSKNIWWVSAPNLHRPKHGEGEQNPADAQQRCGCAPCKPKHIQSRGLGVTCCTGTPSPQHPPPSCNKRDVNRPCWGTRLLSNKLALYVVKEQHSLVPSLMPNLERTQCTRLGPPARPTWLHAPLGLPPGQPDTAGTREA
jgi:hypothetical protein